VVREVFHQAHKIRQFLLVHALEDGQYKPSLIGDYKEIAVLDARGDPLEGLQAADRVTTQNRGNIGFIQFSVDRHGAPESGLTCSIWRLSRKPA